MVVVEVMFVHHGIGQHTHDVIKAFGLTQCYRSTNDSFIIARKSAEQ